MNVAVVGTGFVGLTTTRGSWCHPHCNSWNYDAPDDVRSLVIGGDTS